METFFATVFLASLLLGSPASAAIAPDNVMHMLKEKGGEETVRILHGTEEYEFMLGQVSEGKQRWIEVAIALKPFSDAGFSSELIEAMMLALRHSPEKVISALSLKWAPGKFEVRAVCGDGALQLPASHYQEVLRAMRSVEQRARTKIVTECMDAARKALLSAQSTEKDFQK